MGKGTLTAAIGLSPRSAARLGDASKVKYVPLESVQRFRALQAGEVDLLVSNSTYTLARDADVGFDLAGTYYYDGQGFLVKIREPSASRT